MLKPIQIFLSFRWRQPSCFSKEKENFSFAYFSCSVWPDTVWKILLVMLVCIYYFSSFFWFIKTRDVLNIFLCLSFDFYLLVAVHQLCSSIVVSLLGMSCCSLLFFTDNQLNLARFFLCLVLLPHYFFLCLNLVISSDQFHLYSCKVTPTLLESTKTIRPIKVVWFHSSLYNFTNCTWDKCFHFTLLLVLLLLLVHFHAIAMFLVN